ncbi:hypothetical protein [Rhodobium gokarnense]|uniref:DUF104 domain-containing protein n=1 Tax=Rhodobium gokarnense TaxID=364296 RepID=A0ABT3HEE6_9HYPH|nr:hypothetical protein [Rhodobium gokarnense]MCW2308750.1 hypothetical protein [Rhodobium gokarnense]
MNRIVHKDHYPVDKLPDDLKPDLPAGSHVRITVEAEEPKPKPTMTLEELFTAVPPEERLSREEIDEHIRRERDAWDD